MAKVQNSSKKQQKLRPALSPEARMNQMIALATNLAEQQLMDGTASSQVITHFLKEGTARAELERKKIEAEIEEKKAKVKAIESAEEMKDLFEDAIRAFRGYSGQENSEDYDGDYDEY